MELTPVEVKLVEKFREITDKSARAGDPAVSRSFSFPSIIDSDEQINISVGVSISSVVPRMSEMETRVERQKLKLRI